MTKIYCFVPILILIAFWRQLYCQADTSACKQAGITFANLSKSYINVNEGDDAVIPCNFVFDGPIIPTPSWRVQKPEDANEQSDSTFFYYAAFPSNMRYSHSSRRLIINNVDREMNGTSVACSFESFDVEEICENNATVLIVTLTNIAINTPGTLKPPLSSGGTFEGSLTLVFRGIAFFNAIILLLS